MCKLFKVSRSCYYNWIDKGCIVNKIDKELNELVKNIFEHSRATYVTRWYVNTGGSSKMGKN